MGTAILPGRLKQELQQVKAFLLGEQQQVPSIHQPWAEDMTQRYDIQRKRK